MLQIATAVKLKQTTPVYYVIENSVNYFFCSINICICIYIGSNILKFWKRGFWLFLTSKTDLLTPYFYSRLAVVWDAVVFSKYGQVVEKSDWKQLRSTSWILIRNLLELLFSSCYVSCPIVTDVIQILKNQNVGSMPFTVFDICLLTLNKERFNHWLYEQKLLIDFSSTNCQFCGAQYKKKQQ